MSKRNGVIALIDQALVSGINFVTAVVVARSLAPTSYGYYALLFAALLFINGLQTALITGPLMVIGPRQRTEQRAGYMNSLWVVQLLGCLAAGLAIVGLMVFGRYFTSSLAAPVSILPVLVVVISYLAQEFARRALFCDRDSFGGICIDIISYGGQFLWIIMLIVLQRLTLETVLWAMGLTSFAASLFGLARMRVTMRAVSRADLLSTCSKHWEYGRWLMSGNLAHWGATQFYIFVVAGLLSPAATGLFAAGRNLLGFTNPFLLGLENFVPATMTRRLINDGVDALEHWTNRFRLFSMALVGGYCLLAALFAEPLIHLLFGSKYNGAGLAVPIIALGYFIIACN
ncbi:MAG: oligosaccharide flippase family protein, partial [Chloroflexota bacterium]|nr:oligosaccharide flippase family protein [Chloroflexota bacterium]